MTDRTRLLEWLERLARVNGDQKKIFLLFLELDVDWPSQKVGTTFMIYCWVAALVQAIRAPKRASGSGLVPRRHDKGNISYTVEGDLH